jgi:mono/diheme cytochrome c family protein
LNFLIAPDGQRLFVTNCSACHGRSIAYSGDEEQLRQIISQGGMHLDMPAWGGRLTPAELGTLANYVVDPASAPEGEALFQEHCSACHGERIPTAENLEEARNAIESGGAHQTMPIWGEVLTPEQLDALVSYTLESSKGAPTEVGQELFAQYCAGCHGAFGEGGPNPTRPGDIIAPISSAEYLKTRDDLTLQAIISQGQPNFGMSPFGTSNGGPLEEEDIQAIVAYMRAWEENPPVELPPEVPASSISLSTEDVYKDLCAQCHGPQGEGGVGPSFQDAAFQQENTDQAIFDSINLGHPSSAMIGWGDILSADLIQQLVSVIRKFGELAPPASPTPTSRASTAPTATPRALSSPTPAPTTEETPAVPSFSADIAPIFEQNCKICHGNLGGWDSSSYQSAMESGNNAPVIIPGDPDNSLLARMLQGIDPSLQVMPPNGKLPEDQIQIILDWIAAGAPDN